MKIGVVFPQTEYGNDPAAIRDYAQTAESLGYSHILAYDHILGANPNRPGGWQGPYTHKHPFHEPFILFSYMAAITTVIEFATGILILPQRQTAVVAKQAATLDLLSNGRLRLGVGVGWNKVEYQALNQEFHTRGKRIEAQISLLRRLWTEELIVHTDQWHAIPDAGLNPLPVQRPIPIWFGGHADIVLRRIARMGDGWLPGYSSAAKAAPALQKLKQYLKENGRSPDQIGVEARIRYGNGNPNEWRRQLDEWQAANISHITLDTMRFGFNTAAHLRAIEKFAAVIDN